jgi:transcriptional regulator with XRE-family HTH domain
MKLHEKVRKIRKEKGISLRRLHANLIEIFGNKALRYNTLYRIEKGLRDGRSSSLSQICLGLGVSLKELKEGTEENKPQVATLIRKRDRTRQYVYSEKALAQILSGANQSFLVEQLNLEPGGATKLEQDPSELGRFEKWIYCLKGKITVNVGANKFVVSKDEVLFFESTIPHYFENTRLKKASCLIIQNPKHI